QWVVCGVSDHQYQVYDGRYNRQGSLELYIARDANKCSTRTVINVTHGIERMILRKMSLKAKEEPTRAFPISTIKPITKPNPEVALIESSSRPPLTDPILEIPVPQQTAPVTQREGKDDPDKPLSIPYMINRKMHYLTNDEINAHLAKEDKIKKAAKEAKMFEKTKTEVIKVIHKDDKKIRHDPRTIVSAQADKKIPEELGIQSALPAPIPEQALSQSLRRKRKHMELEPKIKVLGLECWNRISSIISSDGLNDQDLRKCQILLEAEEVDCRTP
nr:hypothetical protein [Tanacetum cinerariifolium]